MFAFSRVTAVELLPAERKKEMFCVSIFPFTVFFNANSGKLRDDSPHGGPSPQSE
jgi:hypothetical protein